MKKIFLLLMMALFVACKTPQVVPLVLRDSVSITYKQGQTPLTPLIGEESEEMMFLSAPPHGNTSEVLPQQRVRSGPAHVEYTFPKTTSLSQRTNKPAVPPTTCIRVDTVFVERWHTRYLPEPPKPIPRFYKDCTAGFWILLIVLIGGSALRLTKLIYRHR